MITPKHIFVSVSVALLVHATFLLPFISTKQSDGAVAEGQDGLLVSVGIAGSFTESADSSKPDQAELTEVNEQPAKKKSQAAKEPKPEQQSVSEAPAEPLPAPEPVTTAVVKKTVEPPVKKSHTTEKKPTDSKVSEAVAENAEEANKEADTSKNSQAVTQATGIGEQVETGGNPAAHQSYLSQILALIARHKRYPRSARKDGVTGTTIVKFRIQRNGRVLSPVILNSSGDERLDKEALQMLLRASPFPRIPREVGDSSLDLSLPIEFSLNPTRKLF